MDVARSEFEKWFSKYWGGISLAFNEDANEYTRSAAQASWEVWRRFWPKEDPRDTKIWNVTVASRYRRGRLIETMDNSLLSSMHPQMVEYVDYAVLHKVIEDYEKDIQELTEKLKKAAT
jgi:hypothetical protein